MNISSAALASLLLGFSMTTHASSFTGTWVFRGTAESGILLKTKQQGEDVRFQMEISRGSPSYDSGWIEGSVTLKNGKGVFHSNEFGPCEIAFEFNARSVRVIHPDMHVECGFGYHVFAEGKLTRQSHRQPKFCAADPRSGGCDDD